MNWSVAILVMQMEEKATFLAYYALFKKDKNATETHTQNIYAVNEEGVVTELTFQKWFAKFHAGQYSTVMYTSWSW